MLVLKKKELVAAALVVLIGVAGYLNWSYQDTVRVTDGDEYIETGKKLGEAQYVSSEAEGIEDDADFSQESEATASVSDDYFAQAKIERDNARSKALEILQQTAQNESFDDQTRKNAQQRILDMASDTEKEAVIENIAGAKGYEEISVYIDGESVDVIVKKSGFGEKDVVVIKQIISEQLGIGADSIRIVEKN